MDTQYVKISVIIPVYKAEKYISRALESVLSQSFNNYEIICVNDGSPDRSLEIIQRYAEKHSNIRIIDKSNEGVWRARLDGVSAASGEYIAFLDADDYVSEDFLEKLYTRANETRADITVCGFRRIDNSTGHVYSTEMCGFGNAVIDVEKNTQKLLQINGALWNKLYRATLFQNVKDLKSRPRALEDAILLMQLYQFASKIAFIPESLYSYMIIDGSTMQTLSRDNVMIISDALLDLKQIYEENSNSHNLMDLLSAMAFIHFGVSIMLRRYISKEKTFKLELKETKSFLNANFPLWKKSRCLKLSLAIIGKGNLKSAIMKHIFNLNLFRPFLALYVFITKKLKIDIKW